ncbi:glycosyltransferase [Sodalis sp. RH19]|uniref:glycosyltransferase n=1 Tax=Sodalis sp. RH19 TaxID=3394334 RepID=UPI0039B4F707
MTAEKSISIYIPTYNRPDFLDRALASVERQTYKNLQVLICDDGSDKNYEEIYEKYKNSFSDLILLRNESSRGACHSRNRMIQIADGEYITGLDDDDEFLPDRIETFVQAKELSEYAYLCAGQLTKTKTGIYRQPHQPGKIELSHLFNRNYVGNQVFVKTEAFRMINGFDESLPAWQDYDAWVRLTQSIGSGFKLPCHTYQLNIDHEEGRISTSPKAKMGYELFLQRYDCFLSKGNRSSLFFQDKINRNQNISLQELFNNYSSNTLKMFVKHTINKRFPLLKSILYKHKNEGKNGKNQSATYFR